MGITIEQVRFSYPREPIFSNLSCMIPMGTITGVIGPNGAGKSTLLKLITGILHPQSGAIRVPTGTSIAYVPQRAAIDWTFPITVYDVVLMGTYGNLRWYEPISSKEHDRVAQALEAVGLIDQQHSLISELSGGQQQRMFLARALAQQGSLYILDEPFAAIDVRSKAIIIEVLKKLVGRGATVIMVHHEMRDLERYFDWIVVVDKGCNAQGSPRDAQVQDALLNLYGSEYGI